MADQFNIVVDGDITPFERKISQIENRIKRMREFGPSGTYSQLSQKYKEQGDTQKAQRMEGYRTRASTQNRRQLAKDLRTQEGLIKSNEMAQQKVVSSMNNVLKTQENINRAKELQLKLEEKHIQLVRSASDIKGQMDSSRGPGFGPFSGTDLRYAKAAFGGGIGRGLGRVGRGIMKSPSLRGGMAAAGAGMLGTAMGVGGQFASQIMTYPERIAQREATTAGMLSETARLQEQRRGYEMELFGPERIKAMEKARTRVQASKVEDATSLGASAIGAGLVGGKIGSFFGPIGTAVGAGVGALTGIGANMFNDRKRSMITDTVGLTEGNYQKEMDAIFSGKYKEQLEVEKAKSYEKNLAANFLGKNSKRFRGLQRQFGLSDQDLFQGDESIFVRAGKSGYNMDTMTQAMQGFGAGGGRASMAGAAGRVSAQMQRNMDLTNAPQLMGKVSGATGGGVNESKDAIIRMYAEATRIGLDASEVRGFLQTTADIASKTGGDTDVISQLLGAGVGNLKTGRGVQASATALDRIRQQTGQIGGLIGQNQLAEFADIQVDGKNLTLGQQAYLGGTDIGKLDPEGSFIKGLMPGKSKEERAAFVKDLQKRKTRATLLDDDQTKELKKLREIESEMGPRTEEEEKAYQERLDVQKMKTKSVMAKADDSFTKLGIKEQDATMRVKGKLLRGELSPAEADAAMKKLQTDSKRITDVEEVSGAKDDVGQLKRLEANISPLTEAFKNNTEKTLKLGLAMDALAKSIEKGGTDGALREQFMKIMKTINSQSTAPAAPQIGGDKVGPVEGS